MRPEKIQDTLNVVAAQINQLEETAKRIYGDTASVLLFRGRLYITDAANGVEFRSATATNLLPVDELDPGNAELVKTLRRIDLLNPVA